MPNVFGAEFVLTKLQYLYLPPMCFVKVWSGVVVSTPAVHPKVASAIQGSDMLVLELVVLPGSSKVR